MSNTRSPNVGVDEQQLLMRAKSNPQAIGEIYDLYADKLYGFLLRRCGHQETAEDLVSKVFIKFIEQVPHLEWRGISIGAYLYRAATNTLTDHWRKTNNREQYVFDGEDGWELPSEITSPSWHAEISIEKDKLLELIKDLSPRDQQVLDLRFYAGLEPDEIAEALNISSNHASVLAYRALGRLRDRYITRYATTT